MLGFNFKTEEYNNKYTRAILTVLGLKIKFKYKRQLSTRKIRSIRKEYEDRYLKTIEKLRCKVKLQKLHVIFVVSETSKWNCQNLYNLMLNSNIFNPSILVIYSKNLVSLDEYKANVDFFKSRCKNTFAGYNVEQEKDIDILEFKPDIVFFQQPWDLPNNQSVESVSKNALTFYIPYAIGDASKCITYHLEDFYLKLYKYFVFSDAEIKDIYKILKTKNISVIGHPKLDTYSSYNSKNNKKKYIIYAPHHSINPDSILHYGTFLWNCKTILNFAKQHNEYTWVFKPHPQLKDVLYKFDLLKKEEIEKYFKEWESIGIYSHDCDYFEYFKNSKCLITDCGSFLTEYLPTESPVIHLRNKNAVNYTPTNKVIMKTYYDVWDKKQLIDVLDNVITRNCDEKISKRLNILTKLKLKNSNTSVKIFENIVDTILENNQKELYE